MSAIHQSLIVFVHSLVHPLKNLDSLHASNIVIFAVPTYISGSESYIFHLSTMQPFLYSHDFLNAINHTFQVILLQCFFKINSFSFLLASACLVYTRVKNCVLIAKCIY